MQWGEIAQRIYETLERNGYGNLVKQMLDENGIGGTPGETGYGSSYFTETSLQVK